jgi:hypothetical protein
MMAVPPEAQEQVRRLYFQLQEVGYPDDLARMGCSIAVMAMAVEALAIAVDHLAINHLGPEIPPEVTRFIGQAKAYAATSYGTALGTVDLTPRDEDDPE